MSDILQQHCPATTRHPQHPWFITEAVAVGEPRRWCMGTPVYDREIVRAGVCALVFDQRGLLMIERQGSHGAGTWAVPGGWMEYGESPLQTASRELLEETNVCARPLRVFDWTNDVFDEERLHGVTFFVLCQYISGVPRIMEPDKCSRIRWVTDEALADANIRLFKPLTTFLLKHGEFLPGLRHESIHGRPF